jgi:hypothetical protein
MIRLIEEMIRTRQTVQSTGRRELRFPHRILDDPGLHVHWPSEGFDLERLYVHHPVFGRRDITAMQAELESALGAVERLHAQVDTLTRRLHSIPGYMLAAKLRKSMKRWLP